MTLDQQVTFHLPHALLQQESLQFFRTTLIPHIVNKVLGDKQLIGNEIEI